ncbi:MAG: hypothetical protein JWM16_3636 [Verrucomicrobiales bacterium]|nr:hypothetical protein [Verrucomicrobiales bacterium]
MCTIYYFVKSAELRPGGVLRIKTAGSDEDGLWDGIYDVTPDDPEYKFWLWLKTRLRWKWFGPAGIYQDGIDSYREEFRRKGC